jgi:acyl-CoA synthetase (AMP-forming)/AMP-acid ligase II/acyl carrier protein
LQSLPLKAKTVILSEGNSAEFVICFFGIIKAGLIPVPVAPRSYLSDSGFKQIRRQISQSCPESFWISSALGFSPSEIIKTAANVPVDSNHKNAVRIPATQIAMIQFSSGSTSEPKGVILSHKNILANMAQIKQGMMVTSDDVLSSWLPFYHDMGLIGGLLSSIFNRVEAHFMSPVDFLANPKRWLSHVAETKASVIMGPNLLYRHLATRVPQNIVKTLDLSNIRLALCGAEPIQTAILDRAGRHLQPGGFSMEAFFPVYGMAESSLAICFPVPGDKMKIQPVPGTLDSKVRTEVVSCGSPLKGTLLRVVGEDGRELVEGQIGEIQIQGPSVTSGYYGNPVATKAAFSGSWLKTGDLGFIKDGEVFISGRLKEVIILNGKNYYPQDIESQVSKLELPRVGRAMAFQDPSREGYQIAVEVKEWRPWVRSRIREQISEQAMVHTWEEPTKIFLVAPCELPRTSSGKLRRSLMQRDEPRRRLRVNESLFFIHFILSNLRKAFDTVDYLAMVLIERSQRPLPDNENNLVRMLVRDVFAEVLNLKKESVDFEKSFFDYKMDSVQIVQLNVKIQENFANLKIELHDFIQMKNLSELCVYLEKEISFRSEAGAKVSLKVPSQREGGGVGKEPQRDSLI